MSALRGGDSEIYCREPAAKYRWAFFVWDDRRRRAFFVWSLGNVQRREKTRFFYAMRSARDGLFSSVELSNVQRRVKTRLFYAMRSARGGLFSCGTIEGVWRFSYRARECAAFLMRDDRDTADIYKAGRRRYFWRDIGKHVFLRVA